MHTTSMSGLVQILVVSTSLIVGACSLAFAEEPQIAPVKILEFAPGLSIAKEAENISGSACAAASGASYSCLLIGDEVRFARFFSLSKDGLKSGEQVFILPKEYKDGEQTKEYDETDAEGIAFADGAYYVIGSHGLNKSGEHQPSRYFLYRLTVDPVTGLTGDLGTKDIASAQVTKSGNLEKIIATTPELARYVNMIPDQQGINIEGIAIKGGQLYVSFRGPLIGGGATIGVIGLEDAFRSPSASLTLLPPIKLGDGQGVRDLAAVEGGFLILTGPQRDQAGPAKVCFWKLGETSAKCHGVIKAGPDSSKPEALTLLETTDAKFRVLIMSDGANGGSPAIYDVAR
ncbi:DUF3616 domain-containing protein [Rhizobium leguminosarum]|uniref:DUF3616 domain-containing protein n=1 Tax=Rhizobium leguminosarum TaxID=384 RepID=UPI00103253D8|nr:DUF3616 domain-containing protein [Rhizobium leguminosarum]TBD04808.1 DUF3616 domain-containing protein [Rhizobium leguminosarum]